MKSIRQVGLALVLAWAMAAVPGRGQTATALDRQVLDLFQQRCADCHGLKQTKYSKPKKPKLDAGTDLAALRNNADYIAGTDLAALRNNADYITRGSAANSPLFQRVTLAADNEERMPESSAKEPRPPLTLAEVGILRQWIEPGAPPPPPTTQVSPPADGKLVNSLGMTFVPVSGTAVRFSIWDTRVQDYAAFATATGRAWDKPSYAAFATATGRAWDKPSYAAFATATGPTWGPTHPAVMVSWEDAQAFCGWLTTRERAAGRLEAGQEYRLPTDAEWSVAVGLGVEPGRTPEEKDGKIEDQYPWGTGFPPPRGAGNYYRSLKVDDFEYTSPVGSFVANRFGLYDMGGNVWQWCEDEYYAPGEGGAYKGARVLRGASWGNDFEGNLRSSYRGFDRPTIRYHFVGFRVVVGAASAR